MGRDFIDDFVLRASAFLAFLDVFSIYAVDMSLRSDIQAILQFSCLLMM
jgi:hypothetical protein